MAVGIKMISGDIIISPSGKLELVSNGQKCIRDFDKMLKTDVESGSNKTKYYRYNPSYGNMISTLIGQNFSRKQILEIASELTYQTIQNYLSLQETRNNLESGEIIINTNFNTYFDTDNPSLLLIPIKITNAEGLTYDLGEYEQEIV